MTNSEASALVIRNLRVFEDASKLLKHHIEHQVFGEVDRLVKEWAEEQNWLGNFDWWNDELWLAPRGWMLSEQDSEAKAWFELEIRYGDDEGETESSDFWWLTRLCGVGINSIGFKWYEDREYLGSRGNRAKWKAFMRARAERFEKLGFEFEEERGRFFLPLLVDQERLAQAYEKGVIEDALQPVITALDKLQASEVAFNGLISDAEKEFRRASGK